MHHKVRIHRRPFLLLETLLAVAMIALCSSFFLSTPMKVYQKHLEDLKKMELSRIADNLFISLQYELKHTHRWDSFKEEKGKPFPLETISLKIDTIMNTQYKCCYQLWIKNTKEGPGESTYRLLGCTFYFSPETPTFSWEKILTSKKSSSHKFSYLIFTSASPKTKAVL